MQKSNRPRVDADFVDLVREMREAQRKWFNDRSLLRLKAVIDAEKKVDAYLTNFHVLEMRWDEFGGGYKAGAAQLPYNFENDGKAEDSNET